MREVRRFFGDASAAAAVEFILASSVITFLCMAGFDFGRFVVSAQRVEAVSYNIAQLLSQTAPSSTAVDSGDGVVTDSDLQWYGNSAFVTFPEVLTDSYNQQVVWSSILVVNMTSIRFKTSVTGCTSNCTYVPSVIWTTGNRPCGTKFTQVPDANSPSPTTLPADLYGPTSQLIVDVTYNFTPTFGANWLPSMTISRTTYISPRNSTMVESSSNSTVAPNCSGVL